MINLFTYLTIATMRCVLQKYQNVILCNRDTTMQFSVTELLQCSVLLQNYQNAVAKTAIIIHVMMKI